MAKVARHGSAQLPWQSSPGPDWLQLHAASSCERSEQGRGAGRGFYSSQKQMLLIEPLSCMPSHGMEALPGFQNHCQVAGFEGSGGGRGGWRGGGCAMCIRFGTLPEARLGDPCLHRRLLGPGCSPCWSNGAPEQRSPLLSHGWARVGQCLGIGGKVAPTGTSGYSFPFYCL